MRPSRSHHGSILVAAALVLQGCVYNQPVPKLPADFPAYHHVDEDASVVIYRDADGAGVPSMEARGVRTDIASLLEKAEAERPSGGHPIRFRAEVATTRSAWLYLVCVLAPVLTAYGAFGGEVVPILAGCAGERGTSHVTITIDTGTEQLTGEGDADAGGSMYVSARRRATAFALEKAIENAMATRRGPSPHVANAK